MEKKIKTRYGQCRCCLTNGNHRDVMKKYYYNGVKEVYCDIFMECFNIFLSTSKEMSTLICDTCVQRLRDANSFKMMVLSCEQKLIDMLTDKQSLFIHVPVAELMDPDLKFENDVTVKNEISETEQDNNCTGYDSDFGSSDDQCIADLKLVNGKENSKECQNVTKSEAKFLSRFSKNSVKRLPTRNCLYDRCPSFMRHLDMLKGKIINSKMIHAFLKDSEIQRVTVNSNSVYLTEKQAHIANATTILENSNVAPFKSKSRSGFPCFYCRNIFENSEKLREHQNNEHKNIDIRKILNTYSVEVLVIYVDITDLKCKICDQNISNLNELKIHLTSVHNKKIHLDYEDRVIPFKISQNNVYYVCQNCGFNFETFGAIERHMNIHYRNHVCRDCGTGFITKYRLKVHWKSMHVEGSFPCEICKKVFSSQQKHKMHVNTVHKSMKRFKCTKCPERFTEYFRRQKHMVEIHGVAPLVYKCNVCDKSFDRKYTLSRHMKRDHLEERDYKCELCSYQCFTKNELRVHMIKHNGERIHECPFCNKSYARKKTLKEHLRIHNNDRRFVCPVCGQAFVQKCSLKGHMKTHHPEYSMQF